MTLKRKFTYFLSIISLVTAGLLFGQSVVGAQVDPTVTTTEGEVLASTPSSNQGLNYSTELIANVVPNGNFDVGPTMFKIDAQPGEKVIKTVQVTSRNESQGQYYIQVEDYEGTQDPNQSHVLLGDQDSRYGAKDWVTVARDDFSLAFSERALFDIEIAVPLDAEPGEHYVTVLVARTPQAVQTNDGTQVEVTSRIGVMFMINVSGEYKVEGQLESFTLRPESSLFKDFNLVIKQPVDFEVIYRNNGSVHLMPEGELQITNAFGQPLKVTNPDALTKSQRDTDRTSLTVNGFNVLRNAVRAQTLTTQSSTEAVNLFFGPYQATLILNDGTGQPQTATVDFWYLPLVPVILILAALIILIIIIVANTKKQKRQRQQNRRQSSESTTEKTTQFKNS